jgi:hypothetical protein
MAWHKAIWFHKKPVAKKPRYIRSRTTERAAQERRYRLKAAKFKRDHPFCEACPKRFPDLSPNKTKSVHHMRGRIQDRLLDDTHWLATCVPCHAWIHNNPKEARALGLLQFNY